MNAPLPESAYASPAPALHAWAEPLEHGGCGPDLEYDNEFLSVVQAANGRPESQFESAQPPDWVLVERLASQLLNRSRDLRVALLLVHAQVTLHGPEALVPGLHSMAQLLRAAWPTVNPPLDEGDPYARLAVLESLSPGSPFMATLRQSVVFRSPMTGELRLKDFDALLAGTAGASLPTRDQFTQCLLAHPSEHTRLLALAHDCTAALLAFREALAEQAGLDPLPSASELVKPFQALKACVPALALPEHSEPHQSAEAQAHEVSPSPAVFAGAGPIRSRQQALDALDQICAYLESAEPTNPAQWLLKRARRLIDKNFLALVKDLAPEALNDVARIMGVDPGDIDTGAT